MASFDMARVKAIDFIINGQIAHTVKLFDSNQSKHSTEDKIIELSLTEPKPKGKMSTRNRGRPKRAVQEDEEMLDEQVDDKTVSEESEGNGYVEPPAKPKPQQITIPA